jgi:hypothetical protein
VSHLSLAHRHLAGTSLCLQFVLVGHMHCQVGRVDYKSCQKILPKAQILLTYKRFTK